MKIKKLISNFVILFATYTVVQVPYLAHANVRFYEKEPEVGALEWTYRWAIEGPEVSLKHSNGELYITGSNSDKKMKIANEIKSWTNAKVENFYEVNWAKDININEMINLKFKKMNVYQPLKVSGINCHGTSLYVSGLTKRLSYVGFEELNYYLDNYCEQVSAPVAGVIGVLDRRIIFSHSFKIIGPHVIFQKRSLEKKDPFKFNVITDYKTSEFFKCEKPKSQKICNDKYMDLQNSVERLDIIYNKILEFGQFKELSKTIVLEIEPLERKVEKALEEDHYGICQPDLLRLKYRLKSLSTVGGSLERGDIDDAGKLLFKREPKY